MKEQTRLLIIAELIKAREKFPSSLLPMIALTEEVGELANAILSESHEQIIKEAVQVAVMAIRVLEEGDPTTDDYRKKIGLEKYQGMGVCNVHDFRFFESIEGQCWACVNCGKTRDSLEICEHNFRVSLSNGGQSICEDCGETQPPPDEDDELPFYT